MDNQKIIQAYRKKLDFMKLWFKEELQQCRKAIEQEGNDRDAIEFEVHRAEDLVKWFIEIIRELEEKTSNHIKLRTKMLKYREMQKKKLNK